MTQRPDIEHYKKLLAGTTPGPWKLEDWEGTTAAPQKPRTIAAPPEARPGGPSKMFPDLGQRVVSWEDPIENPADATLIAAAPEAMKRLIEYIEALESVLLKVKRANTCKVSHYPPECTACDTLDIIDEVVK